MDIQDIYNKNKKTYFFLKIQILKNIKMIYYQDLTQVTLIKKIMKVLRM